MSVEDCSARKKKDGAMELLESFIQTVLGLFTGPYRLIKEATSVNQELSKRGMGGVTKANVGACLLILFVAAPLLFWMVGVAAALLTVPVAFIALFVNRDSFVYSIRISFVAISSLVTSFILSFTGLFVWGSTAFNLTWFGIGLFLYFILGPILEDRIS